MDRREALRRMLGAAATVAVGPLLAGCGAGRRSTGASPELVTVRIDDSLARLVLALVDRDEPDLRALVLRHPALAAVVRHQRLSGNLKVTKAGLLPRILASAKRSRGAERVLSVWAGRHQELGRCVEAASAYLPPEVGFTGTAYLVVGYDIGAAAPPDILLNVGHERFVRAPSEIGFYATHEAHHVGFLTARPAPALTGLHDPSTMLKVVRYMTQLEGMGVHAAYPLRRQAGALGADRDYRVYTSATEARATISRYGDLTARLASTNPLADEEVGTLLTAMSSGERVWYRFGALVCRAIEEAGGREQLVASIHDEALFSAAASRLLRGAAAGAVRGPAEGAATGAVRGEGG